MGCFARDYLALLNTDPEIDNKYAAIGVGMSMIANRISWFYDFRGPSITLDTACSSSLVACHLACKALLARETSMVT
jgi:acyl transferase domain-containing protein